MVLPRVVKNSESSDGGSGNSGVAKIGDDREVGVRNRVGKLEGRGRGDLIVELGVFREEVIFVGDVVVVVVVVVVVFAFVAASMLVLAFMCMLVFVVFVVFELGMLTCGGCTKTATGTGMAGVGVTEPPDCGCAL